MRKFAPAAGQRAGDGLQPRARCGSASAAESVLNNDVEIWLPEEVAVAALQRLVKLDGDYKLLSREFGVVDLRLPDKLYLRRRSQAGDAPPPGPV
jgi:cell division septal protein FtsQ